MDETPVFEPTELVASLDPPLAGRAALVPESLPAEAPPRGAAPLIRSAPGGAVLDGGGVRTGADGTYPEDPTELGTAGPDELEPDDPVLDDPELEEPDELELEDPEPPPEDDPPSIAFTSLAAISSFTIASPPISIGEAERRVYFSAKTLVSMAPPVAVEGNMV